MRKTENHSRAKTGAMDTLLKALNCLGKILQIAQAGIFLLKHLN